MPTSFWILVVIVLFTIFGVSLNYIKKFFQTKTENGQISLSNGHVYKYRLGERLLRYREPFRKYNGISIVLPKKFPQMVLDSKYNNRSKSIGLAFAREDIISLEGDFDKYYQLFAPKKYQLQALSVITPDLMSIMVNSAYKFDIEIIGKKLHIIHAGKIIGDTAIKKEMLVVATRLLEKLDHRLQSWSEIEGIEKPTDLNLSINDINVITFNNKYYSRTEFIIFVVSLVLAVPFFVASIYSIFHANKTLALAQLAVGFAVFPIICFCTIWFSRSQRKEMYKKINEQVDTQYVYDGYDAANAAEEIGQNDD